MAQTVRLFLLPPAGGNPNNSFQDVVKALPEWVVPSVLTLPGRGTRSSEPHATDAAVLVPQLAEQIWREARGQPFALLGHSLGGQLAYAVAAWMQRNSCVVPLMVFVARYGREAQALCRPHRLLLSLSGCLGPSTAAWGRHGGARRTHATQCSAQHYLYSIAGGGRKEGCVVVLYTF